MRKSGLKGARVCLIKSMMQRILGTLKFQGLVLGAKFVLTAPRPVERSGVKGRHRSLSRESCVQSRKNT